VRTTKPSETNEKLAPESNRTYASKESMEIVPVTTSPRSRASVEGIVYAPWTPPEVRGLGIPDGVGVHIGADGVGA